MTVHDWHSYAVRVDQQQKQQDAAPAEEPIQHLSSFGVVPADEVEVELLAPMPPAPAAPAPPVSPDAPALSLVPVEVSPIDGPVPALFVATEPDALDAAAPEVQPIAAVDAVPLVLAAAEVAPMVLAAAEVAPVVQLFNPPANRPLAFDPDLQPVMADRLAGDLADLTRVLLGVGSTAVAHVIDPIGSALPVVDLIDPVSQVGPVAPPVAEVAEVAPITPIDIVPSFAPAAEVAPLVPLSFTQEPPTPMVPTPVVPVDVVLSELSFLDG